jgi:hypothetical protein
MLMQFVNANACHSLVLLADFCCLIYYLIIASIQRPSLNASHLRVTSVYLKDCNILKEDCQQIPSQNFQYSFKILYKKICTFFLIGFC